MALAVPLSRFTLRVGDGSAFFVRRYASALPYCWIFVDSELPTSADCVHGHFETPPQSAAGDMEAIGRAIPFHADTKVCAVYLAAGLRCFA